MSGQSLQRARWKIASLTWWSGS